MNVEISIDHVVVEDLTASTEQLNTLSACLGKCFGRLAYNSSLLPSSRRAHATIQHTCDTPDAIADAISRVATQPGNQIGRNRDKQ